MEPGSPGDRAGLVSGDLLLTLDGQPVTGVDHLHQLLTAERIGQTVEVTVLRHGKVVTVMPRLSERPR